MFIAMVTPMAQIKQSETRTKFHLLSGSAFRSPGQSSPRAVCRYTAQCTISHARAWTWQSVHLPEQGEDLDKTCSSSCGGLLLQGHSSSMLLLST